MEATGQATARPGHIEGEKTKPGHTESGQTRPGHTEGGQARPGQARPHLGRGGHAGPHRGRAGQCWRAGRQPGIRRGQPLPRGPIPPPSEANLRPYEREEGVGPRPGRDGPSCNADREIKDLL
ncbi:hypothetical protein E2C01_045440 [Portunus trituberculatus]|uniref:Uncharacterized protein n=1 Tax=Portunus trituberculatus TaxID=210409 RepID=A0A5B7FVS9_PORTR|nr:hypothetical protein [Portunus trituberculatus]